MIEKELQHNVKLTSVEKKEVPVLGKYNGAISIRLWLLEGIRIFQKVVMKLYRRGNKK